MYNRDKYLMINIDYVRTCIFYTFLFIILADIIINITKSIIITLMFMPL